MKTMVNSCKTEMDSNGLNSKSCAPRPQVGGGRGSNTAIYFKKAIRLKIPIEERQATWQCNLRNTRLPVRGEELIRRGTFDSTV